MFFDGSLYSLLPNDRGEYVIAGAMVALAGCVLVDERPQTKLVLEKRQRAFELLPNGFILPILSTNITHEKRKALFAPDMRPG
jgi:hypothetical protein